MLALYLLTRLPYTLWELLLKANLERIWHIAGPLSLRISIICLRREQCVIKNPRTALITSPFLFFFFFYRYHPWNSSLVPKLLFVFLFFFSFLLLFFPTLILEQYCQLLSRLLSKKWNVACSSSRICNEKESLPHMTPLQLHGRDKACSLFWWLKRGWHLAS